MAVGEEATCGCWRVVGRSQPWAERGVHQLGGLDYGCLQVDVHSAAQMWWQNAGEIRRLVLVLLPAVVWWWVLVGSDF